MMTVHYLKLYYNNGIGLRELYLYEYQCCVRAKERLKNNKMDNKKDDSTTPSKKMKATQRCNRRFNFEQRIKICLSHVKNTYGYKWKDLMTFVNKLCLSKREINHLLFEITKRVLHS